MKRDQGRIFVVLSVLLCWPPYRLNLYQEKPEKSWTVHTWTPDIQSPCEGSRLELTAPGSSRVLLFFMSGYTYGFRFTTS
jgi:hypothetical protein